MKIMVYCYKCGEILTPVYGKELEIKRYKCEQCNTEWDVKEHQDTLQNVIKRLIKIEKELGIVD